MDLSILIFLLLLFVSPFSWFGLGLRVMHLGARFFPEEKKLPSLSIISVLGLILSLWISFGIKLAGLSWGMATIVPLILGVLHPREYWKRLAPLLSSPDPMFMIWWCVHLIIAVTIVRTVGPIETSWANNYGDLAFHMGIITSFSFGDNFPPEYAIFPGIKLSYPFFVNFWSSVLWSPSESFQTLSLVFTFQWMVVWTFVYFLVDGKRNRLTPWAILLGGGSWYALGQNSGPMIEKGAPWAALISTTWVPQRTALCGLLPLLAVTTLSLRALQDLRESERLLCLAGLIAGISLLIHAHFIVAIVAIVGIAILLDSFWSAKEEESFESIVRVTAWRLCFFHLPMLAGLVALPWLIGKTGVIEWRNGWMPFGWQSFWSHDGSVYERISASIAINRDQRGGVIDTLLMWSLNAPGWIALVAIGWMSLRRHATFVALFFVFVLGHLLHFAPWEWDQLKIFVALYVFSVVVTSDLHGRARMLASVFLLASSVPAGYEVWKLMRERPMNTVYSLEEVQQSIAIREHTPPHAKIAAAPNHNSIVTLTGRRLWSGYDGTLWSHGLDYQSRRVILESLSSVSRCASTTQATEVGGCPEYLVWRDPEKSFWKTSTLPDAFLPVESVPFLKRVPARPPSEVP